MAYPHVSVEDATVSDAGAFSPEITVTRQFSADSPAFVRIELTNEANMVIDIRLAHITPFDCMKGHLPDRSASLYLIPETGSVRGNRPTSDPTKRAESLIPEKPIDRCWRLTEHPTIREAGTGWFFDPGATLIREHAVLDGPDSETCLKPGSYRFEVTWTETPTHDLRGVMAEQQYSQTEESTSYSWNFTVTLHE